MEPADQEGGVDDKTPAKVDTFSPQTPAGGKSRGKCHLSVLQRRAHILRPRKRLDRGLQYDGRVDRRVGARTLNYVKEEGHHQPHIGGG